jgi:acyl-coenzyme A thioesterase PaaI-like protein
MPDNQPPDPTIWNRVEDSGPFIKYIGPFFRSDTELQSGEPVRFGFRIEPHHCNPYQTCHGGMLASFLDFCMFRGFLTQFPELTGSPTVTMSIDYFSGARLGEWVESRVEVTASTKRTIFVSCLVVAGERSLLRGTGIYPAWRKDGERA